MPRKIKNKQKQKQKQSQRVVVNIDNSKKTLRRRNTESAQQPRLGTTIINNIPQPQPIYQQQSQPPSIANPQPNITIFNKPNPPIPQPIPQPTTPQINQNYYDEQFDRLNSNINNLNNRFNQHAGNLLGKINSLNPTNNYVYVQPQPQAPADAGYNMFGEDDDITVQTTQTAQTEDSNYTGPPFVNIRQPQPYAMYKEPIFKKPVMIENTPFNNPLESIFENADDIVEQKEKPEREPINRQEDLLKGNYQNEAERRFVCPICGQMDTELGNSNRHLKSQHMDDNLQGNETGEKVSINKKEGGIKTTFKTFSEDYILNIINTRNAPGIQRGNEKKSTKNKERAKINRSTMNK